MQRERLADEFSTSLNSFQTTQRMAAQIEKEQMQAAKQRGDYGDPFAG